MSNKTTSLNSYTITGTHSTDHFAADELLRFNLTQKCRPPSGRSSIPENLEDEYLFTGHLLQPGWDDYDDTVKWAGTFPTPAITVVLDANSTTVRINALFSMGSAKAGDGNELVGVLVVDFQGDVDKNRSDELVLGQRTPVWTPTLGFHGQPLADANTGARQGVGHWVFSILLLGSLVYVL